MGIKYSKSDRTRNFIIETASSIFNTKGYAGTSMSDLTDATGLTKGSIYGNFSSKEEVAIAVFDYNYQKIYLNIQEKIQQQGSYYDKLMVYAKVYDKFMQNLFPQGGCPILNTAVEADDTNNVLKERAAKAINKWKKNVQDLYLMGIAKGELNDSFEPEQLALSIIALIEGGVMISKVTNSQQNLDKILKTVEFLLQQVRV